MHNTCRDSRTFIFNESRCERNLVMENTACGVTGVAFQTARYGGTGDTYAASYVGNVAYGCGYGFYIDRLHTSEMRGNIAAESTEYDLVFTQNAIDYGPHTINSNLFYTEGRSASILLASKEASVETFGQAVSGRATSLPTPCWPTPPGATSPSCRAARPSARVRAVPISAHIPPTCRAGRAVAAARRPLQA